MLRVLSNINMEPLKAELRPAEVSFAGYNQLEREFLDRSSPIYASTVTEILVILDGETLLKDRLHSVPDASTDGVVSDLRTLLGSIEQFVKIRDSVFVFINNVVLPPRTCITFLNVNQSPSFNDLEHRINLEVAALAGRCPNVSVLDWRAVVLERGLRTLTDDKFWYLARVRLAKEGFVALAHEYKRLRTAVVSGPKKVLVLDLDNTLWGGLAGEAGLNGIEVGEEGVGFAYREFQAALKGLKSTGVLLAVASKNDQSDAEVILREHPMQVLRLEDFSAVRINWLPKPENLVAIARELNVGLNSLVFIDDSPVERDLVRTALPMVAVPDFPAEVTRLKSWLLSDVAPEFFGRIRLTNEDLQKTEQYRANAERSEVASRLTVKEYLRTLAIKVNVHLNKKEALSRLVQLIQKTNQFNLTGQRYTEAEIESMYGDRTRLLFTLEYEDKFGKEGTVAAAVLTCDTVDASIDVFVMSCRVIGRNVEYMFLQHIVTFLQPRGVTTITAAYVPTNRNGVARAFYPCSGFEAQSGVVYRGKTDHILRTIGASLADSEAVKHEG